MATINDFKREINELVKAQLRTLTTVHQFITTEEDYMQYT